MKSDPKFCAEVAEKIFGYKSWGGRGLPAELPYCYEYQGNLIINPGLRGDAETRMFRPDVDMNDAMLVWEAALGAGIGAQCVIGPKGERWWKIRACHGDLAFSQTLPLAICRAALAACQEGTKQ